MTKTRGHCESTMTSNKRARRDHTMTKKRGRRDSPAGSLSFDKAPPAKRPRPVLKGVGLAADGEAARAIATDAVEAGVAAHVQAAVVDMDQPASFSVTRLPTAQDLIDGNVVSPAEWAEADVPKVCTLIQEVGTRHKIFPPGSGSTLHAIPP